MEFQLKKQIYDADLKKEKNNVQEFLNNDHNTNDNNNNNKSFNHNINHHRHHRTLTSLEK